jgi:YgiT-type zinc finger domain-containing protein
VPIPRAIHDDADHALAVSEIERLWGAAEGSPEAGQLEALVMLVDAYEVEHHVIDPPAPVLADDACPSCGTLMQQKRATLDFVVNGENILVPDASHLACPSCNEIVLRYEDFKALQERAREAYRQKHAPAESNE